MKSNELIVYFRLIKVLTHLPQAAVVVLVVIQLNHDQHPIPEVWLAKNCIYIKSKNFSSLIRLVLLTYLMSITRQTSLAFKDRIFTYFM